MAIQKRKIWHGSYYERGGILKDKHGNITRSPLTLRQTMTGHVTNPQGSTLGVEKSRDHHYGNDPKKVQLPRTRSRKELRAIFAKKGR